MGDHEVKMGLAPIEELLAERDTLVTQIAPLRAKHGPGGIFQDERKVELAKIAAALRAQAVLDGKKVTEAQLDEMSHSDDRYAAYILKATQEKTDYVIAENTVQGITETIRRGEAIARFVTQELTLSPRGTV
jgi:hypothetical protein